MRKGGNLMQKKLPIGIENFEDMIKENYYYVDKTGLLKQLLNEHGLVNLFTRPRRFGKSLNMFMLKYFFEIGNDQAIFEGLEISKDKELCDQKLRFGAWYAPAVQLGKNIYFCAMPLGSVIGGNFVEEDDVKLGGNIGDALAASSLVTKRVCYELNGETGKVDFLGKDKMLQLLKNYPELKQAYLKDDSQEAKHTFKYLLELRNKQKK